MKQTLLIILLGLGLVALAVYITSRVKPAAKDDNKRASAKIKVEGDGQSRPVALLDGSYQLDLNASWLTWHGEKVIGKSHTGTTAFQSGSLQVQDGKLSGGEFIIDVASLKDNDNIEMLGNHLKSADFFDVAHYPTAKLLITKAEAGKDGHYKIDADLTIKDVTAPVSFEAILSPTVNGLSATSQFEIDRTTWGLKYGSGKFFQNLGDNMINDEIVFTVDLQATRAN